MSNCQHISADYWADDTIGESTSSGIDPVVVNKLDIDTRIGILYLRQTRISFSRDSSVTLNSKK